MENGTEKRPKRVVMELAKHLVMRFECRLLLRLLQSTVRLLGSVKVEQLLSAEWGYLGLRPIAFGRDGADGCLFDFLPSARRQLRL